MRKLSFGISVCALSAVSLLAVAPLTAQYPVFNEKLAHVRYMPEEPFIKVLLAKEQDGFMVDVKGPHNIYDPFSGKKLDAAFMGSSYYMTPTSDGVKWGQEFPGIYQILIVPDDQNSGVMVNGNMYQGVVAFYEVNHKLAAVNWLSLDDFTSALISSNFLPRDLDQKEAIAAYAIALRTKAFQQLQAHDGTYWDALADDCGYRGRSSIRTDIPFNDAVKSTKKIVMSGFQQSPVTIGRLDKRCIDDLCRQMPVADVQAMAKEGKDARVIIGKFFPDQVLNLIETKN